MSDVSQNPALSAATRPLDVAAAALVVLLCLSWGFNQVAVKLAMPDIPPLIQGAIRSAGAGLIVWLWTRARGIPLHLDDGSLRAGLLAGLLFGIEFVLIYRGLVFTNASRAVLFLYSAPFFVVIGSRWLIPGDHFRLSQWIGLALSFAGIAVAFGVPTGDDPRQIIGDIHAAGRRRVLGRHHADDQGLRAQPRVGGKDHAVSARGLDPDPDHRRLSSSANASHICRARSRSARCFTRPSGW